MNNIRFVSIGALAGSLILAGCATGPEARIQEKATVFQALPADQQQSIRNGVIAIGYTPDMVYMALGRPSTAEPAAGTDSTWTYRNYFPSEAVADLPVYRKPSASGPPRTSASLSAWGNSSLPSDAGSRDSTIETPSHGPSRPGGGGAPDLPALTLEVFFRDGKVFSFRTYR